MALNESARSPLQGIRDDADPGEADRRSAYLAYDPLRIVNPKLLPRSMYEALAEAESSTFMRTLLGDGLFQKYFSLKVQEWERFGTNVTALEHALYLSV